MGRGSGASLGAVVGEGSGAWLGSGLGKEVVGDFENVHHLLAVGCRAGRAERRAVARAARTRHTHVADGAHRGLDSVNRVSPALAERIRRAQAEDRAHHHHQRR